MATTVRNAINLLVQPCYQPPDFSPPPAGSQSHAIIDAFRALFVQTSFPPVCQNESGEDDPSIFARAKCQLVQHFDDDVDDVYDEPVIITNAQITSALNFACSDMVIWEGVVIYGAVVVGMLAPNESDITIHVLGLDEWKHIVSSDATIHSAIAQTATDSPCGDVDATMWATFKEVLSQTLTKANTATKGATQKAPSNVIAAVESSVDAVRMMERPEDPPNVPGGNPKGPDAGYTDVANRHAIVPLLFGILKVYLHHTFQRIQHFNRVHVFEVAMSAKILSACVSVGPSSAWEAAAWYKDVLFMIQMVVAKALALKDRGGLALDCGSTSLLEITEKARTAINNHCNKTTDDLLKRPDLNIVNIVKTNWWVKKKMCEPLEARFDFGCLANTNLLSHAITVPTHDTPSYLPLLPTTDVHAALSWLHDIHARSDQAGGVMSEVGLSLLFLAVKSVEKFIYQQAVHYLTTEEGKLSVLPDVVESLRTLLHQYKNAADKLLSSAAISTYVMLHCSRRALCVLVATCIADVALVNTVEEAAGYGLLLNASCVDALSLDTADAREAALAVAAYVHTRHSSQPLFGDGKSLPISPTQTFAGQVARRDVTISTFAQRQHAFIAETLRVREFDFNCRKEALKQIRSRLQAHKAAKPEQYEQVYAGQDRYGRDKYDTEQTSEYTRWKKTKQRIEEEEEKANAPMDGVVFPCPSDEAGRYVFSFFCNTPHVVQLASALVAEAISTLQELLDGRIQQCTSPLAFLSTHVERHGKSGVSPARFGVFTFTSDVQSFVPKTLDGFTSSTTGVAYPALTHVTHFVSPFDSTSYVCMKQPTTTNNADQRLQSNAALQRLVSIDRDAGSNGSSRGNDVYANVNQRPNEFTQQQFNLLGEVRAYPSMQLQSVCLALDSFDALPLDHPVVDVVLRQAMYQMGPYQEAPPYWTWHAELLTERGQDLLYAALYNVLERIESSPKLYKCVPLITSLVHFFAGFDPLRGALLSNRIGSFSSQWADERRRTSNDDDSRVLVAQYWYFAARAFAHGYDDYTLHSNYTAAIVAAHHAWVWNTAHSGYKDVVAAAALTFAAATSTLLGSVHQSFVDNGGESVLSDAVRKVRTVGMPIDLAWAPITVNPTAYVATDAFTSDQYMLDIHTGLVLMNGLPVDSLPANILSHPLYIRTFGHMNFEVLQPQERWRGSKIFATICERAGYGRGYHFAVSGSDLLVRELPLQGQPGRTLSLLPHSEAQHLPTPIYTLYGHWADIESDSVLVRDVHFSGRTVYYAIRGDAMFWVPPSHRGGSDWHSRRPEEDAAFNPPLEQLVVGVQKSMMGQLCSSLKEFEPDHNFIECRTIIGAHGEGAAHSVVLTRYSLEFDMNGEAGEVRPRQWRGMRLATRQQLRHQLPNFTRYFVLEDRADSSMCRIIVPQWCHAQNSECPQEPFAQLKYASYSLHPTLQLLEATTLRDRLQLAALQVSSCNGLPQEPCLSSSLTGVEAAMASLKACFPHKPFSSDEAEIIDSIAFLGMRHPYVVLRCVLLWRASQELSPLYSNNDPASSQLDTVNNVCKYGIPYKRWKERAWPTNLNNRLQLTSREERMLFGSVKHSDLQGEALQENKKVNALFKSCRFSDQAGIQDTVHHLSSLEVKMDNALQELSNVCERHLFRSGSERYTCCDSYPLSTNRAPTVVDKELESSWDLHASIMESRAVKFTEEVGAAMPPAKKGKKGKKGTQAKVPVANGFRAEFVPAVKNIISMYRMLSQQRSALLHEFRAACGHRSDFGKMAELGHAVPTPTIAELLSAPLDTDKWCPEAISAMLCWMTATVLSDKLSRLWIAIGGTSSPAAPSHAIMDTMDVNAVIQVLASRRVWDVSEYPSWLIFEVVNRLQSWPEQARVAMRLCKEGANGDITQLNMGLGKTRVIVPFVVLHSVFHTTTGELPRMQVLPELEAEFTEYASLHLGASPVCPIHIVSLPFNRSLHLGHRPLERLVKLLTTSDRITVVTNPTAWLSMKLHLEELTLRQDGDTADRMRSLLGISRFDILDEADMSLHHRFRLAYSWGTEMPLPDGPVRWNTLFGLLRLRDTLPESDRNDPVKLYELAINDELCVDFRRLKDQNVPVDQLLDQTLDVRGNDATSVVLLAVRCWLGFSILNNACSLRYRVQYGLRVDVRKDGVVDECDRELLAVPYRACDTPAPKAHFAHPDMSLALTTLTYLNRGLDRVEMTQAIKALNAKGIARKEVEYGRWCSSLASPVPTSIDTYAKLDLTNAAQFDLCLEAFRLAPPTIYFWLGEVLFPAHFTVFPQQLMKTAFDVPPSSLEVGSRAVGFSGTKEAHILLPSQVHLTDMSDDAPELQATDGCMLDLVYNTATCVELDGYDVEGSDSWKVVLDNAMDMKVDAIIDRGGLLVGVTPRAAAKYLFSKGITHVTFFEYGWRIADCHGRELPKGESPVPEADTMVIYDEARTRGSDMKLKRDAIALLTIDSRTTKDDFMQAVGRLRQFARRQKVVVAYLPTLQLPKSGPTEIARVLRFVVNNSARSIDSGLIPWCDSATRHGAILGGVPNSLEPCPLTLDVLYAPPCVPETPSDRLRRRVDGLHMPVPTTSQSFFAEVEHHVTTMIQGAREGEQGINLEVELERQQEIEEDEEEVEKQHAVNRPGKETSWRWASAVQGFAAMSIGWLAGATCSPLNGSYSPYAHRSGSIQVMCTQNYWNVFHTNNVCDGTRRRSAFLWYPQDNTALLLTHYECSMIRPLVLALDPAAAHPVHLCFLGADSTRPHAALPPLSEATLTSDAFRHALVSLLLEDGRTMFTGALSRQQLKDAIIIASSGGGVVGGRGGSDLYSFAMGVVGARGRLPLVDGSDLDDALV